jgi:inosine/xanthosine triphosphatase
MKTVIIASKNPIKIQAVQAGFAKMFSNGDFEYVAISIPSQVPDQPLSDQETLIGAHNRAHNARKQHHNADYWIGIEGGIHDHAGEMSAFAWVVVLSPNQTGKGRTGTFYLPSRIAELVRSGVELGEADDMVFNRTNSKQTVGAVGLLTREVLNRTQFYESAVVLALIPFLNPKLY